MQWPARVRLDSLSHMNTKIDLKKRPTNMKINLQKRPIQMKRDPQNAVTLACTTRQASARVSRLIVSHVTRINESLEGVTWLIHTCDLTHSCVPWLIHTCDMAYLHVWQESFISVTWLNHTCDMTHSYVWHESFISVTRLIHTCDMTRLDVWQESFISVTRINHTCDTTYLYVWQDSFTHVRGYPTSCVRSHIWMSHSCHTYEWLFSLIHVTDMNEAYLWHEWDTHVNACGSRIWVICDLTLS